MRIPKLGPYRRIHELQAALEQERAQLRNAADVGFSHLQLAQRMSAEHSMTLQRLHEKCVENEALEARLVQQAANVAGSLDMIAKHFDRTLELGGQLEAAVNTIAERDRTIVDLGAELITARDDADEDRRIAAGASAEIAKVEQRLHQKERENARLRDDIIGYREEITFLRANQLVRPRTRRDTAQMDLTTEGGVCGGPGGI